MNRRFPIPFPLRNPVSVFILAVLLFTGMVACRNAAEAPPLSFEVLDQKHTGIDFVNKLTPTASFNMFKYMYFYNGAGVGAGDFNNDGKTDLFFASNQGDCKMYLNEGDFKFRDVSAAAGLPRDGGWSTGVSVVDLNSDGLLDLYICRVGNYESLQSHNLLLMCDSVNAEGVPVYREASAEWGLRFSGFSTQAAFFDYDLDGDLDCYLMNHSLRFNGTFSARGSYQHTYDSLAGDRFFRNDGRYFTDVTRLTGIQSSIIGYGLGLAVSDINLDGYPDLYIGNDFHENDYLYINQRNGTFRDTLTEAVMHTSQFSMGVDVADVDNDAWPEIISMDMLPYDPYILKRSLGEDAYDIFQFKIRYGYHHQYARNNLQWNRRNGLFSEIGLYAGVYATDWSWAPLWMDFDNDGRKDLFITNGIPKRLNDMDYVNFASNEELQQKIRENRLEDKDLALVNTFPEIKLSNQFFANRGNLSFENIRARIGNDQQTFSNGAVYADFDNDGDLDIAVNNVDDPALIYRNTATDSARGRSLELILQGSPGNVNAIGARVLVYTPSGVRTYEKYPVRGFQSSMEIPLHAAWGAERVDSLLLVWPDRTVQRLQPDSGLFQRVTYRKGLPSFDFHQFRQVVAAEPVVNWQDLTKPSQLSYRHEENPFVEFDREPLIPHMVSREGPALAVGDINADGREDVFVGSSKTYKPAVFLQQPGGRFTRLAQPALDADSMYEEVDACWVDVNNDRHPDLVVADGGNEYYGEDEHLMPRVFLNDGAGHLVKKADAFPGIYLTASCIIPQDINGDGYTDLFVGGRAVPWEYGANPRSYLLLNDGKGSFRDVTIPYAPGLAAAGFVTGAQWADLDGDRDADLVVSLEWGVVTAFMREGNTFRKQALQQGNGWWQFVQAVDIDRDGDLDLVAGNLGWNSRLQATSKEPVRMYYNDFDGNGKKEQILTYFLQGKEIVFANKDELQKQLPGLKKEFLYAADFAKADPLALFGAEKLAKASRWHAEYFAHAVLLNDGKGTFTTHALPWAAQLSPLRSCIIRDVNGDLLPDLIGLGNFYHANIQMGRYDADYGTVLIQKRPGTFEATRPLGLKGEVRRATKIMLGNGEAYVLAHNNDSLQVISFR